MGVKKVRWGGGEGDILEGLLEIGGGVGGGGKSRGGGGGGR